MARNIGILASKEELEEMYWGRRMSLDDIASHFGVSRPTVRSWVTYYGIRQKNWSEAHSIREHTDIEKQKVSSSVKRAYAQGRMPNLKMPSKEKIERLYLRGGQTIKYLAREFQVNRCTVRDWLRKFGIPTRKSGYYLKGRRRGEEAVKNAAEGLKRAFAEGRRLSNWQPPVEKDDLERLYSEKRMSLAAIAPLFNTTPQTVRNWMEHWGLVRRPAPFAGKPTAPELQFDTYLAEWCPNEWLYNGDGEHLKLGRRKPDWININSKKQLIELWGDYYHRGQNPEDRIAGFRSYGYSTLVIWEHELKDLETLREKVLSFGNK